MRPCPQRGRTFFMREQSVREVRAVLPTCRSLLQNSHEFGHVPLKGAKNPYSHNSVRTMTIIRSVTDAFDRIGRRLDLQHATQDRFGSFERPCFRVDEDDFAFKSRRRFPRVDSQCDTLREKKTVGSDGNWQPVRSVRWARPSR